MNHKSFEHLPLTLLLALSVCSTVRGMTLKDCKHVYEMAVSGEVGKTEPSLPNIDDDQIRKYRAELSHLFRSFDLAVEKLRIDASKITSMSLLGSGITLNSFGVYTIEIAGEAGPLVMKVPLRWNEGALNDHLETNKPLLMRKQPLDPRDDSDRSRSERLRASVGIILNIFLDQVGREIGVPIVPTIKGVTSNQDTLKLLKKFRLTHLDDAKKAQLQIPNGEVEAASPTVGIILEKIDISHEARDDAFAAFLKKPLFREQPHVTEQGIWLISLLNRLGIIVLDANPVYIREGRVILLDLDNSLVYLDDGKIVTGVIDEEEAQRVEAFERANKDQNGNLASKFSF